jgi:glycosyltransferase involved in cell wall biosynthesis
MISIIIPVHNGEGLIQHCLSSIYTSKIEVPFEVIIVDDGSSDGTGDIVRQFPCHYFKIKKSGVAAARNFGITKAKGETLFFFDSDVRLKNDTIAKFLKHFQENKDVYIIQGRWAIDSPASTLSRRFLLLKYTYNLRRLFGSRRRVEVANLETGCMAIRAEVFKYFKGFDEGFKSSGGEEHEFGTRLLERYKIYYYSDIFVEHAFGNMRETMKKIYRRTINFSILAFNAKNSKDFMRLHRGSVPTQDKISVVVISLLLASCFLSVFNIKLALVAAASLFIIYLLNISKFIAFLTAEENLFFAAQGVIIDLMIMLPRLFGFLKAVYVFHILRQEEFKL